MTKFVTKRIYESADSVDGYRVLVDRLWPRGISKEKAALDEWAKDVAPSDELRKWFDHDPKKYAEFQKRYQQELRQNAALHDVMNAWKKQPKVTLLYGAHDTEHNQAIVLMNYLS